MVDFSTIKKKKRKPCCNFFSPSLNLKEEEYLKNTVTIEISSFSNKKFIIIHNNS